MADDQNECAKDQPNYDEHQYKTGLEKPLYDDQRLALYNRGHYAYYQEESDNVYLNFSIEMKVELQRSVYINSKGRELVIDETPKGCLWLLL